MAESFTKVIVDAVEAKVPPPQRRTHNLGWFETPETSAAFIAWDPGRMHDDSCALILGERQVEGAEDGVCNSARGD